MHRLFSSSYEAVLGVISLYYFSRLSTKFDRSLVIVIALQSFSFVIRNTSPIGWVVLLTLKALRSDFVIMFKNYIIGFIMIFLPIFSVSIALDSWYYGKLTIVPWNFIRVNVFDGLSQNFGADPVLKYVNLEIPIRFNIYFPCIVVGMAKYTRDTWNKGQTPYLVYYILSILVFLSMISHKEPKFLLPIFPPIFLMIGYCLAVYCSKTRPKFLKFYVYFGVALEIAINLYFVHLHEIGAGISVMQYIRANHGYYDSLISLNKFEGNYYSWNHFKHQSRSTGTPLDMPVLLFATHDPPFVKHRDPKIPLIQSIEHPLIEAIEFMNLIETYHKTNYTSAAPQGFTEPTKAELLQDPAQSPISSVPEFAIVDHLPWSYCR